MRVDKTTVRLSNGVGNFYSPGVLKPQTLP